MTISISPDFVVNTTVTGTQDRPAITVLQDGRFVVAYYQQADIGARVFNADGSALLPDFFVNNTTLNSQDNPAVASLADGRFIVTWQSDEGATSNDIRARIFNADGSVVGPDFVINTTTANSQSVPVVSALADGRFIVTWQSDEGVATGNDIRARIFNADGSAAASDFVVNTTTANGQGTPAIGALADGRFIVTWESNEGAATGSDIRARVFKADGTAAGSDFIVNSTTANTQNVSAITALADGRLIATWTSDEGAATGSDIRARIINADGSAVGADFIVNSTAVNTQRNPAIASLADGRLVITWQSDEGTRDVRATILDPKIFIGTSSSDGWTGGDREDSLYGLAGDDSFSGKGANDYLNGGDGLDTLFGDAGNDTLDGGTGNDLLSGGAGDDRLIGGRGTDTLKGGKGADRYIYRSVDDGGDTVQKFGSGDKFVFDNAAFKGLKEGSLKATAFISHSTNLAGDFSDRFIYRTTDDTLWYDDDGKGAHAAIKIADLTNNFDLKAADILIV